MSIEMVSMIIGAALLVLGCVGSIVIKYEGWTVTATKAARFGSVILAVIGFILLLPQLRKSLSGPETFQVVSVRVSNAFVFDDLRNKEMPNVSFFVITGSDKPAIVSEGENGGYPEIGHIALRCDTWSGYKGVRVQVFFKNDATPLAEDNRELSVFIAQSDMTTLSPAVVPRKGF